MHFDHEEISYMSRAIELARDGQGMTRPNPPVGAVLVKKGRIVGEGCHLKAGERHAEIHALEQAGSQSQGAKLYVTLEPCSTAGRTPACTTRIIQAGIKEVVFGCRDPNPQNHNRATHVLDQSGISCRGGCMKEECVLLIAPFQKVIHQGQSFVSLKMAVTLDGRTADSRGTSKWITGRRSRELVQQLRRAHDAVIVGAGTLRQDDPSLLPRPAYGRKTYRVIVAGKNIPAARAAVFSDKHAERTLIACPQARLKDEPKAWDAVSHAGAQLLPCKADRRGFILLDDLLTKLAARGLHAVLIEGGSTLAGSLIKNDLVDVYHWFVAGSILGENGVPAVKGPSWSMPDRPQLRVISTEWTGDAVYMQAIHK